MRLFQGTTFRRMFGAAATILTLTLAGITVPAQAQGFSHIYEFTNLQVQGMNQQNALGQPTQARDGMMYGYFGCCSIQGIYRMPTNDKATLLGYLPSSACSGNLTLGNDGLLYGVCGNWSNSSNAVIFQMDPNSPNPVAAAIYTFSKVFSSGIPDLTVGPDGNFYGVSPNDGAANCGTVYRVSLSGSFKVLHTFMGGRNDGCFPTGPLFLGKDGNFYGVSQGGFSTGTTNGAIFKISPAGKFKLTVVGLAPTPSTVFSGGVIQASDGYFYGTSSYGGASSDGYVWKMSTKGVFTDLHDFSTNAPGGIPLYALIQASDGNIYGTAAFCNSEGCNLTGSAIFEINLKKKIYVDVFSGFDSQPNGYCIAVQGGNGCVPSGSLLQHTNGTLYGVTAQGSTNDFGTFYQVGIGQGGFIQPMTIVGKIGTTVGILGQGFLAATAVTFNGVSASFSVSSDGYMTAVIPAGATAGYIRVTEGGGTLSSVQKFNPKK